MVEESATLGWTVDPQLDLDIVGRFQGTLTTASEILLVCEYTATL